MKTARVRVGGNVTNPLTNNDCLRSTTKIIIFFNVTFLHCGCFLLLFYNFFITNCELRSIISIWSP